MRFHFQVRTGTHVMVTEVTDLSNSEADRVEVAKRIGLLLHDHAGSYGRRLANGCYQRQRADPFRHKHFCDKKRGNTTRRIRDILGVWSGPT